ncbi:DUF6764 family protein [Antrihabitans cavernicola]|uniref:Protein kinase n=1 Tax=Antrihabitans cavernicola TaxID=2495913 RepID=A0A5A7S5E6_9NOCA|nr:DUF6764 family protein [Spelaeibacter cavernicola]KAA0019421.1 hypothetical protein FOY51_22500 [Spelaeibacter cavernicola]
MKMLGVIACSAMALGAVVGMPATAGAANLECHSADGKNVTRIDGQVACGADSSTAGNATAYGINGIGYAKAVEGARALGIGMDGGVGASEGGVGMPTAVGVGPKSVAITSVGTGSLSLAVALGGSQALVGDVPEGVLCQGNSAFAINVMTGRACVATGFGSWRTG